MSLEEAIEHHEKQAKRHYKEFMRCKAHGGEFYQREAEAAKIREKLCRQHAEWLKELQECRKQPEIIRCGECKHKGTNNCVANVWTTIFGSGVKDDFYCGLAERRTDSDGKDY